LISMKTRQKKIDMNLDKFFYSLLAFVFLSVTVVSAQNGYQLGTKQEFKVTGTSTLHDWDMNSSEANGEANIELANRQIQKINSLKVTFPVKSLKSGNSRMDRTAYSAINADKFPQVSFDLTGVRNITAQHVFATGNLTIAGQTRPVSIRAEYKISGSSVHFTGNHSIKFTQFDVEPPTALLGTVRTGDEMQIFFDVSFVQAK
jgi:polyisoprenoid-binding protein YceI